MMRYSIVVTEHGSERAVELVQVNSNPQAIVDGLRQKTLTIERSILDPGQRAVKIPRYTFIEVVDRAPGK
jgi:hypothetical protein